MEDLMRSGDHASEWPWPLWEPQYTEYGLATPHEPEPCTACGKDLHYELRPRRIDCLCGLLVCWDCFPNHEHQEPEPKTMEEYAEQVRLEVHRRWRD